MSVSVFAPAKVNLTLEVGRPRTDGYHPLQSVVTFADIGDVVHAEASETLSLAVEGEFDAALSAEGDNLVLRAAHALAREAGIATPGAALRLEKNLPVASGIGGGSADAAATLRALNELWSLDWPLSRLTPVARQLGADVPVCLASAPAYMTGIGDTFAPMAVLPLAAVLANPLKPLSTPDVYARFDAANMGGAFVDKAAPMWIDAATAFAGVRALGNDLTKPALALLPVIGDMMRALSADPRALCVSMSGSGATVFAVTEDAAAAADLAETMQRAHPDWWIADTLLGGA